VGDAIPYQQHGSDSGIVLRYNYNSVCGAENAWAFHSCCRQVCNENAVQTMHDYAVKVESGGGGRKGLGIVVLINPARLALIASRSQKCFRYKY